MDKRHKSFTVAGRFDESLTCLHIDNGARMKRLFTSYTPEDTLEISFKKQYRQRSIAQNNWMWGVCVVTVQAWHKENTGELLDKNAVYAYLRQVVVGHTPKVEELFGQEVIVFEEKSFSQMTTVEFSEAVDKIIAYFDERGLEIPLPKKKGNNLINDYLDE